MVARYDEDDAPFDRLPFEMTYLIICECIRNAGHIGLAVCHLVCLAWRHLSQDISKSWPQRAISMSQVAAIGRVALLQWADQNGCPSWMGYACEAAAENGHLEALQWLCLHGSCWDENTCKAAARRGHLEVLRWARQNGCPCKEGTCANAAKEGRLEILQWARLNGCPWNELHLPNAAEGGHLEVLQWARQNGCPWDQ